MFEGRTDHEVAELAALAALHACVARRPAAGGAVHQHAVYVEAGDQRGRAHRDAQHRPDHLPCTPAARFQQFRALFYVLGMIARLCR